MDKTVEHSENSFFRFVWRFNALAIAGAAIVFLVLGVYAAASIFRQETRERRVTNVVNVSDRDKVSEEFTLGSPTSIAGTAYVQIPLYRGQSYAASYYSKSSGQNDVNYLFLNVSTNESKWVFEGAGQLIIVSKVLFSKLKSSRDESQTGVGLIYTVVEKDTNGDGRLSERDAVSLAVSDVDGRRYRKLIENIEQLYSVQQITDDKVLVLYQKNRQAMYELYSVPSMVQLQQSIIPQIKLN
jgi:hypothetical protein